MAKSLYIQNLIAEGEHQKLDFKFEISDARKIAKSFVAFANTYGGKLLIGIKDNGEVAGVRSEEEKFMAKTAAEKFCNPPVEYASKEWTINSKTILEIRIPPGNDKPYYALNDEDKWLVYVRVNDQNILANRVMIEAWKRKKSAEGTYITYTFHDKLLLEYLEKNESITLSNFKEIAGLNNTQAQRILINFLSLDIIRAIVSEDEVYYALSEEFKELP